ncbi:MAG: RdgB/HAM1 family non-canonical purine NTP pyrophosphatase [Chloroflexi bacterium OLB15]|nr:MAG: RdgB/HAM1 family non-canonical purine NTP pyrophosphatase [Chloroflexi bacterium OLB15]
MIKLLIGTNNPGKLREYLEILAGLPLETLTLAQAGISVDPDEPHETFEANALHKARVFARESGLPALADDSGLSVDALQGRPGVYSKRYAGPNASDDDRMYKVLSEIEGTPDERRGAQFVCVSVLALPDGRSVSATGIVRGLIAQHPGERINGFGYDPIFIPEGYAAVFSELPPEVKNSISHRGRAAQALLPEIKQLLKIG